MVHIRGVCSAFIAGIEAPGDFVSGRAFKVGMHNGNFTVRDIAQAAQRAVPGSELIFTGEHTDPRTYRVSSKRTLMELGEFYKPEWDLNRGSKELTDLFDRICVTEKQFRGRDTIRLKQLGYLNEIGKMDESFRLVG